MSAALQAARYHLFHRGGLLKLKYCVVELQSVLLFHHILSQVLTSELGRLYAPRPDAYCTLGCEMRW